jgi:hypothetical protein
MPPTPTTPPTPPPSAPVATSGASQHALQHKETKKQESLARLKTLTPRNKRDTLPELPGWVKAVLTYKHLYDIPPAEALKALNIKRAPSTLEKYAKSPAARKLRGMIRELSNDPVAMAELFLRSSAMAVTVDRLAFLEMAKAVGDYAEADRIARDMQDRIPELTKKQPKQQQAQQIVINLAAKSLDIPHGDSIAIQEGDFEVEAETE